MRTRFIAVASTAALLVPVSLTASTATASSNTASPGTAKASTAKASTKIIGTWKGTVTGDSGAGGSYSGRVKIFKRDGKLRGKVVAGSCVGVWRYKGRSGGTYRFTEILTDDTEGVGCIPKVNVKVNREGAKLRVVWTEPVSGDSASMLASKA